jgi:hypothetical protein
MRRHARAVELCALLGMLSLASGCALPPLSQRATAFSTAATATVARMQNAYGMVEQTYEDAEMASLVNQFDRKGFSAADVHPMMADADLKARTELLNALRQYASLLAEVSGKEEVTELDKQSEAVGTNLQALSKDTGFANLASSAQMDGGIAATAVDALGRVLMEKRTAKELPSILDKAREPVDAICTLLAQDIGTPEGKGLRNELRDKYVELIADQQTYILLNEAKMSPGEKRMAIERLPRLVREQRQGDATLAQTAEALRKLATTNDALTQTKKDKNAPAFREQLSEMEAQGQQLGSVYGAVATK